MARKKYIDDNTLITLIDTYYLESGRSERALQLPQITDYINTNGYPKYQVTSLRRNIFRSYLRLQKKKELLFSYHIKHWMFSLSLTATVQGKK